MSKVIFISPYLKGGSDARRSNLVHYVATREGVEVLTNDVRKMPPTKKQQDFIRRLVRDFPAAKEMLEYEDYMALPNRETAWELINQMYEQFVEPLDKKENFIDYVANRPGAQQLGEHGLWCSTGKVPVLASVMREVADHQGNVWTPVVSIRREDAVRLGYTNANQWRSAVNALVYDIARGYKIHPDHLRWYAALHEKENSYHIHMVIYSTDPREGYLTKEGIRSIRSAFTRHMFKDELVAIYKKQTEARNVLQADAEAVMQDYIRQMQTGEIHNEKLEQLITELTERLKNTTGRKVYGYLPPSVKRIVDEIVEELAKEPRVAGAYALWQEMRDEVCHSYGQRLPERLPLSQQKEFKHVRNMVIREALQLAETAPVIDDTLEDDSPGEQEPDWNESTPETDDIPKADYTIYEQAMRYQNAKRMLQDELAGKEDLDEARATLERLWDEGYTTAAHLLGKLYRDGRGVERNSTESLFWFRRSAEAGNDYSQHALGKLLIENGDVQAGIHWLELAATQNNQYARYRLGKIYLSGMPDVPKDVDKALEYLVAAAKQGNQYAQYTLGKMLLLGKDLERDEDLAVYLLTLSADQGNPYAKYFLDHKDQMRHGVSAHVAAMRMMHHMGNIFRDNTAKGGAYTNLTQIDKKRRKALQRKRLAAGHKAKDHEEQAPSQQTM